MESVGCPQIFIMAKVNLYKPRYLCFTHSSRPLDFSRSSRSFLHKRYSSPNRLENLPDFKSLSNKNSPSWINNVTVWEMDILKLTKPNLIHFLKKDYTANHAIVYDGKLIICGTTFLEICDLDANPIDRLSANWFAGGHTVYTSHKRELVVSCAASDALLVFNLKNKNLIKSYRMPKEFYGQNYNLKLKDNVRSHYINNDLQLTHLNCGYPVKDGYLVTAFIQGAVGLFKFDGTYHELSSGFLGCHGARTRPGLDGFYFSDTCAGALIEMDWKGRIVRRFTVKSKWLHDCQWVTDDIYLFSVSDGNKMQLWDIGFEKMIWELDMSSYGGTTLLFSMSEQFY